MSLASLLLGSSQAFGKKAAQSIVNVDGDLDALFRSNPAPSTTPKTTGTPISIPTNESASESSPARGQKRKRQLVASRASLEHPPNEDDTIRSSASKPSKRRKSLQKEKVAVSSEAEMEEDDEDNDAQLEDSYLNRTSSKTAVTAPARTHSPASESSGDDDAPPPAHETHADAGRTKTRTKPRKKTKYVPPDETPAQRDARTIFVGNIPVAVAKSKSSQKQLKRYILSLVSGSKIESVRFRSVAFAAATTDLPTEDAKPQNKKGDVPSTKQQRQKERASQWRDSTATTGKRTRDDDGETSEREDQAKKASYLSPAERKRVAFIKGEFHEGVDTVNAYVVFAHTDAAAAEDNDAAGDKAVHPFKAARLAVERCDSTVFMDRTIRVDRVGQWRVGVGAGAEADGLGVDIGAVGDPRATLFVGNLDFAAKEEELRVWFEGVVSQERGPQSASGDDPGGSGRWVRNVRIVRDRDTQLGKGFAYVRFLDRECVDEILGLEEDKLKFAKRKLRVQRCKVASGPASTTTPKYKTALTAAAARSRKATAPPPLPKGDPSLGAKLAGLSKDERKAAKASNVDRVQRRLAKKKVKAGVEKAAGGKMRERERRGKSEKGKRGKAKPVNKGRLRSEKSVEKRNAKK